MKILIVAPRIPYPIEKGDKLRLFNQIRYLSRSHQVIVVGLTETKNSDISELTRCCSAVYPIYLPKSRIVFNVIRGPGRQLPIQVAYFYSRRIKSQIHQIIFQHNPDVIYTQLIRSSMYTRGLPFPKVIDFMDCFSLNTERRARQSSGISRWFWQWESHQVRKFEKHCFFDYDAQVIISEFDRAAMPLHAKHRMFVIPNGIDTGFYQPQTGFPGTVDILFAGNMGYYPNIKAAQYLVEEIKPLVARSLRWQIAGARPDAKVSRLQRKGVEVTGWVEDLRQAYANAKLFVAPIWEGAGLQNKILEAMAMGLPTITTPVVNNSINGEPGKHLLIAKNPAEFSKAILTLLDDRDYYREIAENGRNFVRNHYQWDLFNEQLENVLIHVSKPNQAGN
ncbi:MAG: glycosyltransferase [Saprospiraceae bacterium]